MNVIKILKNKFGSIETPSQTKGEAPSQERNQQFKTPEELEESLSSPEQIAIRKKRDDEELDRLRNLDIQNSENVKDQYESYIIPVHIKDQDGNNKYIFDISEESKLGLGSFADVYRGVDIRTGKKVAVKISKKGFNQEFDQLIGENLAKAGSENSDHLEVQSEAGLMGRRDSLPGLPNIYDAGEIDLSSYTSKTEVDNHTYFIMERFNKEDNLAYQIFKTNPETKEKTPQLLSLKDSVVVVDQLCDLLSYLHQTKLQASNKVKTENNENVEEITKPKIFHRDIKPGNIFIIREGNSIQVKLVDFGATSESLITTNGNTPFSPNYSAPEAELGPSVEDETSDIYSLAITMFMALTGKKPFEIKKDEDKPLNGTDARRILKNMKIEADGLPEEAKEVLVEKFGKKGEALAEVLSKALRAEKEDRTYKNADAFAQAYKEAVQ